MAIPSVALNAYAQAASMGGGTGANAAGGAAKGAAGSFGDFLEKAINETVSTGKASEHQMAATAASKDSSIVDVVTAVSEAETTLQTVVAIRDKVIAAYQDIIKMPI
ncbi:flagellar hook-basal body complex protein FliE [Parvibaculum sp.]|uniref:flagellar hook-basal body complex protein FliE n=1 Tax=Parvibaculum sp. TaxID=2024848 RepID=UPI0025E40B39|nr:flagellar hook-basal body complex protein FliE [Parvibaculum sp.]